MLCPKVKVVDFVEVFYDTSTGTATRAARYGLLLEGLSLSSS
jgi:hypothetical protein